VDGLVIGSTDTPHTVGPHQVKIRRQIGEPYIPTTIHIVREATYEEWELYQKEHGLRYALPTSGRRYYYYAFWMD
jgi:hypothetical protein